MVARHSDSKIAPPKADISPDHMLLLDRLCWRRKAGVDMLECTKLVLDLISQATDSCCGAAFLRSGDNGQLEMIASRGLPEEDTPRDKFDVPETASESNNGVVSVCFDSDEAPSLFDPIMKTGARAGLLVPVQVDGFSGGIVVLGSRTARYTEEQVAIAETMAEQSALALQRAQECIDAEDKVGFLESICQISNALVGERDLDATLAIVVERAASVVNAESTAVGLLSEDGESLRCTHAYGRLASVIVGMEFDPSEWPLSQTVQSGLTQALDSPSSNPDIRPEAVHSWDVKTALLAPLKLKNTVIGALVAGNKRDGAPFSPADLRLFEALANYSAVAIANSRLYAEAQESLAKLDAERTKLNGILTDLGDGVVVCDAEDRVILVNRAAEEIMEVHAEKILGKNVAALHPMEHRKTLAQTLRRLKDPVDGEAALYEARIVLANKIVRVNVSPVVEGGKYTGLAMVLQDVTATEEVGRAKTEFVSMVAHELRTPLTTLKGSIGLIKGRAAGQVDAQSSELLDIAQNNLNRLIRLVDDMMDIAKIEADRMSLLIEPVSLYECAVEAVKEMQQVAADKSISLMVRLVGAPPLALADHDRMQQVITNLLANAIRFSPTNGEVIVTVRYIRGYVRVSVQDFGSGIPRKDLKKVFDKFYQVGGIASRKDGGTGLGLAISKAIVEQHGGRIYARSASGQGSAFVFTIPIPSGNTEAGEESDERARD